MHKNFYLCPSCFSPVKDWRAFPEKSEIDQIKPFECTGLRCGKRWDLSDVLQGRSDEEN